jgi:hypothetical protein
MICVKIYPREAKPEVIGELRFDGKRVTTAKAKDQQDAKLLKRLLERPAILRGGLTNHVCSIPAFLIHSLPAFEEGEPRRFARANNLHC